MVSASASMTACLASADLLVGVTFSSFSLSSFLVTLELEPKIFPRLPVCPACFPRPAKASMATNKSITRTPRKAKIIYAFLSSRDDFDLDFLERLLLSAKVSVFVSFSLCSTGTTVSSADFLSTDFLEVFLASFFDAFLLSFLAPFLTSFLVSF